jgi:hypothetical protein
MMGAQLRMRLLCSSRDLDAHSLKLLSHSSLWMSTYIAGVLQNGRVGVTVKDLMHACTFNGGSVYWSWYGTYDYCENYVIIIGQGWDQPILFFIVHCLWLWNSAIQWWLHRWIMLLILFFAWLCSIDKAFDFYKWPVAFDSFLWR